jgi:hypothetical protein
MSSEPPKTETLIKRPPWPTVDPLLQRTAWIIGIILGALTLTTHFVVPYFEVWTIALFNFGSMAWYIHKWHKEKSYLASWSMQPLVTCQLTIAFLQAALLFAKGGAYPLLLASLCVGAAFSWYVLLLLSAYEQHNSTRQQFNDLWEIISRISTTQGRVVDAVNNLAEVQQQIIKGNAVSVFISGRAIFPGQESQSGKRLVFIKWLCGLGKRRLGCMYGVG